MFEDVLVTDAHGDPVHGLPRSAFHVSDQGKSQTIRDFEEGAPPTPATSVAETLPPGVFTNAVMHDAPGSSEVVLIDTDDIAVTDQMYLRQQLMQAINNLPSGLQASVFSVQNGRTIPVLGMTTDRAALARAVGECLPVQTHAIDSRFQNAVNQLMTVSALLQQTPGRKNLLWFSGEFPLVSVPEEEQAAGGTTVDLSSRVNTIHQIQQALAEARISVYPVDVRGMTIQGTAGGTGSGAGGGQGDHSDPAARTRSQQASLSTGASVADQRGEMRELARVTGGKAYFLNNLSQEVSQALELGAQAYTLTYSPADYKSDQSWHRVAITVDGGYSVAYRTGYLATWTGNVEEEPRYRMKGGVKLQVDEDKLKKPLLFHVRIAPVASRDAVAKHSTARINITFTVPADQLMFQHKDGAWDNALIVTSYAYDLSGKVQGGKMQELDTHLADGDYAAAQSKKVSAKQQIDVPGNTKYVLVYVRDKNSLRTGSIFLQARALAALPSDPAAQPTP